MHCTFFADGSYQARTYFGQVTLVAPLYLPLVVFAGLSQGAVIITTNMTSHPWWFVTLTSVNDVNLATANTICRQLGYTNAIAYSTMNLATSALLHGYQYNLTFM